MNPFFASKHRWILVGVGLLLMILAIYWWMQPAPDETVHLHADFTVYINGEKFNFAQEKYMTGPDQMLNALVHLHDMDGNVIHVHAPGITLGMFFESIGMELTNACFTLDDGTEYCEDETHPLWVWINGAPEKNIYVNGKILESPADYVIQDLDRILITYGTESWEEQQVQFNSVTDNACIQSGKCPERGEPSPEDSCSGSGECGAGPIAT